MRFICRNKKCPSKGNPQDKIMVISESSQTLDVVNDTWGELEPGDPVHGLCGECSRRIPPKTFAKLLNSAEPTAGV
jgi:hypothetical protein